MLTLKVTGQTAAWSGCQMPVSGSEGIYALHIDFEDVAGLPSWSELDTFAVIKNSAVPEYQNGVLAQITDGVAAIPACILMNPGRLFVGVCGQREGIMMPTIWAPPIDIIAGCAEGSDAGAEVLSQAENAIKYGENAKVYAEGGYLVISVHTTIGDPVITREDTYTPGAKEYAQDVAGEVAIAEAAALKSEGFAVGEQDGTPVASGSPYYENNAKFYKEDAAGSASDASDSAAAAGASEAASDASALKAEGFAVGEQDGTPVEAGSPFYHNNAEYYNEQASSSASAAAASESASDAFALEAEGFAVGEQNGVPVTEGSPYYENNAKFYSQQRAELAEVAVGVNPIGEASGDVVTISDAAAAPLRSLKAQVVPKQDLNGQAYPWPAGGGKNKLDYNLLYGDSPEVAGTYFYIYKVLLAPNTTYTFSTNTVYNGWLAGNSTTMTESSNGFSTGIARTVTTDENGVVYIGRRVSGNPSAAVVPKSSLDNGTIWLQAEIGSSATAYAPYSNFCPITGWTGANIYHGNKNLMQFYATSGTSAQVDYTHNADGTVTANGTSNNSNTFHFTGSVYLKSGVPYKLSGCPSDGGSGKFTLNIRTSGGTWATDSGSGASFTVPTDGSYNVSIRVFYGYAISNKTFKPMVTVENAEQTFIKDTTAVATLDWSTYGTVYGGTIEAVTGAGSDKEFPRNILQAADVTQRSETSVRVQVLKSNGFVMPTQPLCTHFQYGSGNGYPYFTMSESTNYVRYEFLFESAMTVADFKAFLAAETAAGHSVQAMIGRATPTAFSVTPTPISTLKGDNNVWADCGAVDLEYLKAIDRPLPIVIPPAPAGDGSYHLAVTVDGGVPVFSWEADA